MQKPSLLKTKVLKTTKRPTRDRANNFRLGGCCCRDFKISRQYDTTAHIEIVTCYFMRHSMAWIVGWVFIKVLEGYSYSMGSVAL